MLYVYIFPAHYTRLGIIIIIITCPILKLSNLSISKIKNAFFFFVSDFPRLIWGFAFFFILEQVEREAES